MSECRCISKISTSLSSINHVVEGNSYLPEIISFKIFTWITIIVIIVGVVWNKWIKQCDANVAAADQNPRDATKYYWDNKKVLLRECKRHTARRIASTPSVVLMGEYPIPGEGYPILVGGTPSLVVGYPGVPPIWTWPGYPPSGPGWGTPCLDLAGVSPIFTCLGYPHLDLDRVPPRNGGQTENITSCHPSDVGGNNLK